MPTVGAFYIHREYELWDAILPSSWTDGTDVVEADGCNRLIFYFDVTMGNSTSINIRVLFSDDQTTWYPQFTSGGAAGVLTMTAYYRSATASGQYRLTLPIMDKYIKVQVQGEGADLTDSNLTVKAFVGTA